MLADSFTADSGREPKRPRMSAQASQKAPRTIDVESLPASKKQRLVDKTTPITDAEKWKLVVDKVLSLTPRVGRTNITDETVIQHIFKNCYQKRSFEQLSHAVEQAEQVDPQLNCVKVKPLFVELCI